MSSLNTHADICSNAGDVNFVLSLHPHLYFVYANRSVVMINKNN